MGLVELFEERDSMRGHMMEKENISLKKDILDESESDGSLQNIESQPLHQTTENNLWKVGKCFNDNTEGSNLSKRREGIGLCSYRPLFCHLIIFYIHCNIPFEHVTIA